MNREKIINALIIVDYITHNDDIQALKLKIFKLMTLKQKEYFNILRN